MFRDNLKKIVWTFCVFSITIFTYLGLCQDILAEETIKADSSNFETEIDIRNDIYDTSAIIPKREIDGSDNTNGSGGNSNNSNDPNSNDNSNGSENGVKDNNTNEKNVNANNNEKRGNFLVTPSFGNTELKKIQKNNNKKFGKYKTEYNSAILGTIAYILKFLAKASIVIFAVMLIASFAYSKIIKNGSAEAMKRAHNVRSFTFKLMIVCQILPLIFALIVKGWRK